MYRDPWAKKSQRGLRTLTKIGTALAKAHTQYQREQKRAAREAERRAAAYNRMLIQNEKERIRRIKQNEVAIRRAERERAKAEREREKALKLQQKIQEQLRFEDEVSAIEDDNFLWTNIHSFIDDIITLQDVNDCLAKCDYECRNDIDDGFYDKKKPEKKYALQQATQEANAKFNIDSAQNEYEAAQNNLSNCTFVDVEPTMESVEELLTEEARDNIKAFFPWKQKRLRREYVETNLDSRYNELHNDWESQKHSYEKRKSELENLVAEKDRTLESLKKEKTRYITDRSTSLYNNGLNGWRQERDEFFDSFKQNFQNVIDGDKDYVISAIDSIFPDDELPMEYFVDAVYDESNGKVYVDLDLPEIEDIPDQKIALTSTGKKSIRQKSQTDLRSDYAHCVLGLAMNVAFSIFNVSLKIKEVEIMGYTQRKEDNSAVATDQYVFVINFDRETFSKIAFKKLSAVQIIDFFKHHINLSKSFVMKQIDLNTAFDKMDAFAVADYDDFKRSLPIGQPPSRPSSSASKTQSKPSAPSTSNHSSTNVYVDDAPIEAFEKASRFMSKIYGFIDRLSKDHGVNRHAENLDGVRITMSGGNFPGDGNTSTYRGKLFFCSIMDLFRCLIKMQVNMDGLTPPNYALARYALKIFGQLDFQYYSISTVEKSYRSFVDMMKPMDAGIPAPPHVFLLTEVLCDYEKDLTWHKQYLELIEEFIDIVKSTIHSNVTSRVRVEFFRRQLKSKGIQLPTDN